MAVARLRMLKGPEPGRVYLLTTDTVTIGRLRRNEVHIQDDEISKEHCRLVRVLHDFEIHDLESTNGTFVNGKPIQKGGVLLAGGQKVELGSTVALEFLPADDSQADDGPGEGRVPQLVLMIRRGNVARPDPYPMNSPEITIGRALDNEIVIPEPQVSKHHMRLARENDGYTLEDLGSLNGTYVNEERLKGKMTLKIGDIVRVGTALEMTYTNENISSTGTHEVPRTEPDTVRDLRALPTSMTTTTEVRTGQLQSHLFLLSARDDREQVAEKLYLFLKAQQVAAWIDRSLQPESDTWNRAVEHALIESPCLIAALTQDSVNRVYVQRTLRTFINKDRPVLLLLQDQVRVPMFARNCPAIVYTPETLEDSFRALLAELKRLKS